MTFNQAKAIVRKYFKYWRNKLGLNHWDINIDYPEGKPAYAADGWLDFGSCSADWSHQNALIVFYLDALKNETEASIERTVIHELLHIIVNEMREKGIKHEERVVADLTNAFVWVKEGALK